MVNFVGWVINNYSSCGQVQIKRPGYDDNIQDDKNCFWTYVDQGARNIGFAGMGEHHALQPGCRVQLAEYGPHSYVVVGTFGRMGSGQGSGGSSGDDSTTSYNDVNLKKTDWPVPTDNPQQNGSRCTIKPPDGRYSKYAGGQPFDFSQCTYPNTPYKDA